jgi:NAD(P)-dependent dehydrogenase (short-subunit alcohol dehydrogenase family)
MTVYEDLIGKTVLINGGTRGIGLEIVHEFLNNECYVIFTGRTPPENLPILPQLQQKYGSEKVLYYAVDSSNLDSVKALMLNLSKLDLLKKQKISVLVNNAGINFYSEIYNIDYNIAKQIINTNFFGYLHFITEALPLMDTVNGSSIINISSVVAYISFRGRAIYAASKAAVESLTRSAALELAHKNIRVNSVVAGTVFTDMVKNTLMQTKNPEAESARLISRIPLGRFGTPSDVAKIVKFLASKDSSFITGASIFVDGGTSAGFNE